MKRAPGTGGIRKLPGKRRKPYQAVITTGKEWKNGRIVQKQRSIGVFATRRDAQMALEEYNRFNINIDLRTITFAEVYEIIQDDFTESMKGPMRAAFKHCAYLHNKRMIDIRKYDLDIVASQAAEMSASTQTNIAIIIKAIFRWCMENDVLIKDYSGMIDFKHTKKPKKKKPYSKDEIKAVLEYGSDVQLILLYSGMRINELLSMKNEEVYSEDGVLCFHVNNAKTESGIRIIPVHSEIAHLIKSEGKYVVEPHLSYNSEKLKLTEWNKKHNMNHTFHELRHTFSTRSKECGMDDFYRRALLGHAQKGVTDRIYTHANPKELLRQIEMLHYESDT